MVRGGPWGVTSDKWHAHKHLHAYKPTIACVFWFLLTGIRSPSPLSHELPPSLLPLSFSLFLIYIYLLAYIYCYRYTYEYSSYKNMMIYTYMEVCIMYIPNKQIVYLTFTALTRFSSSSSLQHIYIVIFAFIIFSNNVLWTVHILLPLLVLEFPSTYSCIIMRSLLQLPCHFIIINWTQVMNIK